MQDAAYRVEDEAPTDLVDAPKGRGRNPNSLANLKRVPKGDPSPNPRGRPKKDYEVAAEAAKYAPLAIKTLADICANEASPEPSRISAASTLLDRAFGRAPQSINMKTELTFSEQFEDFIRQINAKVVNGSVADQSSRLDAIELSVCDGVPESKA